MTWSELGVIFSNSTDEIINVIGNAAPVQDVTSKRIWMPFCRNNEEMLMTYSDDDGATWAYPIVQPHLVMSDWKWIGVGPPAGLQLSTGRVFLTGKKTNKMYGFCLCSKSKTQKNF